MKFFLQSEVIAKCVVELREWAYEKHLFLHDIHF